jgi:hypothetical protein
MKQVLKEFKKAAIEKTDDEIRKHDEFFKMLRGKIHISYTLFELKNLHLIIQIVKHIGIENLIIKKPPKCRKTIIKKYWLNIFNSMKLMYEFYQKNKLITSFINDIYFTISSQMIPIFIDVFKTSNIDYSSEIRDLIIFNRKINPAKGFLV